MATIPLHRFAEPMADAWRRPLSPAETAYVALVLFVIGMAYCQLYCAIAMPAMQGMSMPLQLSMWRSAIETVPAFAAFELSKRVLSRGNRRLAIVGVGAALLLSAVLSIALMLLCHGLLHASEMPLRPIIADRIPGVTLTAIAIAWASRQVGRTGLPASPLAESQVERLPPAEWIDWVQAAGNYVEIHIRGRVLLKRMTLRQAAELLGGGFVQIHRSILVNRARIAHWDRSDRPRHVRLADGSVLRVGQAYRISAS